MPPVTTPSPCSSRLGALAAAALVFLPPGAARAERRTAPSPAIPPPVQPLAVKVQRGEPGEILLRTYGRKNETLQYLIRTPPEHGRLTEPRAVERDISAVTYTPPADLAVVRDRFSYAAQNGAGVSAAAEVVITIVDAAPLLDLPVSLEFPAVLAGATVARSLEITNRGGGLAEGRVSVEAPWKIDGSANYRLGAGTRAVIRLVFAPVEPGTFDRLVRFSSQPDSGVAVHGEARAALRATPATVLLLHPAGDPGRVGEFALTNQTDVERRVTLTASARLQAAPEITVPAQGTARVTVQMAGSDVAALDGEVRAEAPGITVRVPVRAAAVGPIVRAAGAGVVFGRVPATTPAVAGLGLENIGGTVAAATLAVAAPFAVEPASVQLLPGEKKTVAIRVQPAAPGKYRAGLTVKTAQQILEIPVEAEWTAPSSPDAPQLAAAAPDPAFIRTAAPEPSAPPDAAAANPPPPGFVPGNQRLAEGVKVTGLTPAGFTLEWPVAMSEATQFRLERLQIATGPGGEVLQRWEELPGTAIRRADDRYLAVVQGLQPATVYNLRVMPVGPDPETTLPLFTQNLATPPAGPGLRRKVTPLRVLLFVAALCVALIVRQRLAGNRRS